MATKKSQRIGIWIIAIAMVVGTLGGFLVMILAPKNQATEQARIQQLTEEYQTRYAEYQNKVTAENDKIAAKLSEQYFDTFNQYASRVGAFDAAEVTELRTEDLLVGDGAEVTDETAFAAYYILWLPDGTLKEQSITDGKLGTPIKVADGLKNASLITGWKEGMIGMKLGGVRELTIPSSKGYGDQGSKNPDGSVSIAPNTPLKFIVMAIPSPDWSAADAIAQPEMPKELQDYYKRLYGADLQ